MNKLSNILSTIFMVLISIMMIYGAYNHLSNPEFYSGFIPDFFSKTIVNYVSALAELIIGVMILIPYYKKMASLSFIALMIAFIPIHIWDLLKDTPAIGSKKAALIRIIVQFLFIAMGYFVFKKSKKRIMND